MKTPSLLLKRFVRRGNRGIAVVYIALLLIALLAFVGLAIDIGYMYVAKTQLQNAADAATLAGAAKLTGGIDSSTSAFYEEDARKEAWKFACKNKAATEKVYVQTNSSLDCNTPPIATELNASSNS
jgi:Flp pilus assembly protein TadG